MSRTAALWVCVGAALAVGAVATVTWWPGNTAEDNPSAETRQDATPQPSTAPPVDVARFMASDAFANLSKDEQQKYFDKAVETYDGRSDWIRHMPDMTDAELEQFRKNTELLFYGEVKKRVNIYTSLPKEEKAAYLDKMIDQMNAMRRADQERRAEMAKSGQPVPPRTSRPHQNMTPERMKERIEQTPPEDRAKAMQFMQDMMKRMIVRGLSLPRELR